MMSGIILLIGYQRYYKFAPLHNGIFVSEFTGMLIADNKWQFFHQKVQKSLSQIPFGGHTK